MHHYHHRAFYLGVLGVVLIAVGLLALDFPVFTDAYDRFGFQIKCGTGLRTNLTQAIEAGAEHTRQCQTALLLRRAWTIPLVVAGSMLVVGTVFLAATVWGRESAFGKDPAA